MTVLHWDRFAVGTGPFDIWFMLLGLLMLSMAHESHRDRVRIVAPFLVLLLPLAALQLSRFAQQVDWRHPRLLLSAALLAAVATLGVNLLAGPRWLSRPSGGRRASPGQLSRGAAR